MGQESDALKHHIDATREELGSNIQELEVKVKTATDWRHQFCRRPGAFLAGAFAVGLLLSRIGGR